MIWQFDLRIVDYPVVQFPERIGSLKILKEFHESQKETLSAMFPFTASSPKKENSEKNNPELDELKKQMAEMQKKLDTMG